MTNQNEIDVLISLTTNAAGKLNPPAVRNWESSEPDSMAALELTQDGAAVVAINANEPFADITRRVADLPNAINPLRNVAFWVGDNSLAAQPFNESATRLLHYLLTSVREGRFPVTHNEFRHVTTILATPEPLPVLHGPCVITGSDRDGTPLPLDEYFRTWFTELITTATQCQDELLTALARSTGLPPEAFGSSSGFVV